MLHIFCLRHVVDLVVLTALSTVNASINLLSTPSPFLSICVNINHNVVVLLELGFWAWKSVMTCKWYFSWNTSTAHASLHRSGSIHFYWRLSRVRRFCFCWQLESWFSPSAPFSKRLLIGCCERFLTNLNLDFFKTGLFIGLFTILYWICLI